MKDISIPVAEPALVGNERHYVMDCLDSNWISSNGKYIKKFEDGFGQLCAAEHAVSCSNGTVALHLALLALGVGPGDEVIVPTLTFVSTANAVAYCGAKPVFIDSENETWNMDVELIEGQITENTKAIIAVHLYGHPVDMDSVMAIARRHDIAVIEDAAEAHGAQYKGRPVGAIGDIGTFSFYGNKVLTTGEGGMVVTNNEHIASDVRLLRGQGMDPERRYWFTVIGYNYRLTNIAAAIGVGQLEKIEWHLARRREVADAYARCLSGVAEVSVQPEMPWARNVYWMNSLVLGEKIDISRDELASELAEHGIETRPFFVPMHELPMYQNEDESRRFVVAERLSRQGLSLPSSASLEISQVEWICDRIKIAIAG
ncbi:MAG: DegT/DnrJ/EryC1/StrS family aminotransferase [Sedimenticola sp.]